MNILLLTKKFPPETGGIPNYYKNLILNCRKIAISVVTAASGLDTEKERDTDRTLDAHIQRLNCMPETLRPQKSLRWATSLLMTLFHVLRVVRTQKIDYVLVGQVQMFFLIIAYVVKKTTGCQYILFLHGEEIPQVNYKTNWLLKFLYKKASASFSNSSFTSERLKNFLPSDNPQTGIVTPGVEDRFFEMPFEDPSAGCVELQRKLGLKGRRILYTIARLDERKGQDMVLEALPLVIEKHPDLTYCIGGVGPMKEHLEKRIKDLNLCRHVKILGMVPHEDIVKYHSMGEVFIMPNRILADGDAEGFGIVFLEANAVGNPVIGGNEGGSLDAICDGVTGFLVDPRDARDIADKICRLLAMETTRVKMGTAGRDRAWKQFRWPDLIRRFEDAILDLYAGDHSTPAEQASKLQNKKTEHVA